MSVALFQISTPGHLIVN